MKKNKLLFICFHLIFSSGCSENELPPARHNDYYRDTKQMEKYIKAQGIDKAILVWSTEGPWSIDLSDSSVTNLDWSIGISIDKILVNNTAVSDLSPLKHQQNLRWLEANNTKVVDLSPLAGIKRLETLEISNTKVADLAPVQNIEITDLNIQGVPCDDLSDIPLKKLRSINFSLDPSKKWKGIKRLRSQKNLIVNRFMNNEDFWTEYDKVYENGVNESITTPH